MKIRLLIPATLFLTILVWMVLSWPLPLYMTEAIPYSLTENPERQIVYMVPSDSIQFLYYLELVREWITGTTPWFYNLYEFNTGNDSERYFPGGYYAPFSLIYSFGANLAGQAFGMNLTGLISLWITMLATWMLLRRYVKDEWVVGLFCFFVLVFPYRWKTLFDGSPTGLAMMWVPIMILGLDMAVREGKVRGGLLAGTAIVMAYFGDAHVFFFNVLVAPAWCILALTADPMLPIQHWRARFKKAVRALLPVAFGAILVFFLVQSQAAFLQETMMQGGRSIGEVSLFSPTKDGFFTWKDHSISSQVFLGWTIPTLIIVGLFVMSWAFLRRPREQFRSMLFMGCLCMGILVVAVLALGPHGLRTGGLFSLVRELIPPYAMIRQAGKIFCLMPTLLAVAGALALASVIRMFNSKPWWRWLCLVCVAAPMTLEYTRLSFAELTFLQKEQAAYSAVVEDARTFNENPRAVVIPLWPGDSHFASIYQYYALKYRIRMVNGYTPAVAKDYFTNIFLPFQNINQGYFSSAQIEALLAKGIRYLILHEDLYPDKVAPFPVTYVISQYLKHPQLHLLERSDSVWAFRLLDTPAPPPQAIEHSTMPGRVFLPSRHWEMERSIHENARLREDPDASGGRYVTLSEDGAMLDLARTGAPPAPKLRWMIRLRGQGLLSTEVLSEDAFIQKELFIVDNQDWHWLEVPVEITSFSEISLRLRRLSGEIDLDSALLAAGEWTFLKPGESKVLPAASFFRAGYTDNRQQQVVFLKKYYAQRDVLYGPLMPMAPGLYDVEITYASDAGPGVELGTLHIMQGQSMGGEGAITISGGMDLKFQLRLENNLPVNLSLFFSGHADMTIDTVLFTRVE